MCEFGFSLSLFQFLFLLCWRFVCKLSIKGSRRSMVTWLLGLEVGFGCLMLISALSASLCTQPGLLVACPKLWRHYMTLSSCNKKRKEPPLKTVSPTLVTCHTHVGNCQLAKHIGKSPLSQRAADLLSYRITYIIYVRINIRYRKKNLTKLIYVAHRHETNNDKQAKAKAQKQKAKSSKD